MLGVRRPGVTVALKLLEEAGMVRARRGIISIIDRTRLERLADRPTASQRPNIAVCSVRRLVRPIGSLHGIGAALQEPNRERGNQQDGHADKIEMIAAGSAGAASSRPPAPARGSACSD